MMTAETVQRRAAQKRRSVADAVTGGAMVLFGIALLLVIIPAQVNDAGSFGLPPSLAPRVLATIMLVCGLVLLVQALATRNERVTAGPTLADVAHWTICIGTLAAALVAMNTVGQALGRPWAGFLVVAPIALVVLTAVHGRAPLWAYAVNALLVPGIIYGAFWYGLSMPMA